MQFKSDKPFPETSTRAESGTPVIDLDMTGGVDFDSEASRVIDGHVEGQFLDDNTYACIFRYDLAQAAKDYTEYNEKYNEMSIPERQQTALLRSAHLCNDIGGI